MSSNPFLSMIFFFFFLLAGFASSATFISDAVFESHGSAGRTLLQSSQACSVNFESLNYTIITSKCRGPQYPANLCCDALKVFACPYADQINDMTTNCASTMFSYINLYGKYPPGIFANECRGDKDGLSCPANATETVASGKNSVQNSSGLMTPIRSSALMFTAGFIMLLFQLF